MFIHNLSVDDGCPLAGATAWPLATLTQYGYGMVVRHIIKHPTQHSLFPPIQNFKASDGKCQLISIGTLFPTRNKKLQISNNCPGANDVCFFLFFLRTIGQKYRVKQVSRLARLSWAGRQFVVNEGYWGLQVAIPGHLPISGRF